MKILTDGHFDRRPHDVRGLLPRLGGVPPPHGSSRREQGRGARLVHAYGDRSSRDRARAREPKNLAPARAAARPSEQAQLESASGGPSALMLLRSHRLPLARRATSSEPHVLKLATATADHGAADPRARHLLRSTGSLSFAVPDASALHGKRERGARSRRLIRGRVRGHEPARALGWLRHTTRSRDSSRSRDDVKRAWRLPG